MVPKSGLFDGIREAERKVNPQTLEEVLNLAVELSRELPENARGIVNPLVRRFNDMFTLTLDSQEKAYLESLLESDLAENRVEVRRTRALTLHDEFHKREKLIRDLLERLRGDKPPEGVGPRP